MSLALRCSRASAQKQTHEEGNQPWLSSPSRAAWH